MGYIMPSDNSVTIGEHFSEFVRDKINEGRFESVSEVIRAGLRLLEVEEARLELLHETLSNDKKHDEEALPELQDEKPSKDEQQADKGEMNNVNDFMHDLSGFRK